MVASILSICCISVQINAEEESDRQEKAKEDGYAQARAQLSLGHIYRHGLGVTQDNEEAMKWFRKAAEQGYSPGLFNLGEMYYKGHGVPQDYTEAIELFRKAADQGNVRAQSNLGTMYRNGLGVRRDIVEAIKWYNKAAEQGHVVSQFNLGWIHKNGSGATYALVEAYTWFSIAASNGEENAAKQREELSDQMNSEQIADGQAMARKWLADYEKRQADKDRIP